MSNEKGTIIKDLIFWDPPIDLQMAWAEYLKQILQKNNNASPSGWFRYLLNSLESKDDIKIFSTSNQMVCTKKKNKLTPSEKEMIIHLQKILPGFNDELLANLWGITTRAIRKISNHICTVDKTMIDSLKHHSFI